MAIILYFSVKLEFAAELRADERVPMALTMALRTARALDYQRIY